VAPETSRSADPVEAAPEAEDDDEADEFSIFETEESPSEPEEDGFDPVAAAPGNGAPLLDLEAARARLGEDLLKTLETKFAGRLSEVRRVDGRDHLF